MKTSFLIKVSLITLSIIAFVSCKDKGPHFTIEGKIAGADTTMLYLERRSLNEITIIDSVKLNNDGNFKFEEPALGYPEFYLLRIDKQSVNLAIDSVETITINANKQTFSTDYTVEGSESSVKIKDIVFAQQKLSQAVSDLRKRFESKEINQDQYVADIQQALNEYKTQAKNLILSDYMSLASYFALFQKVDGYLIFDPYDKNDLVAFRAVATVWDQFKSESPRAKHLKTFTLTALAGLKQLDKQEAAIKKLEKTEATDYSTFYNITLSDINNKDVSLSSLKGKVIILDFTAYQTEFSPAHNILINNVYSKNKGSVEVYQVSFDPDIHAWKNSAINLPWTCVRDNKYLKSELLAKFNIQGFPTTYLMNKNGEIVKRILASDDLAAEVQKLL
jgi:cytochrome oxidase Cu insertion factor (SCO1/SenC/PrrC family)